MIANKEKITEIQMFPTAHCLCRIGRDWYTIKFNIRFIPNKYYPDYIDVREWLLTNIDGQELNIEEAVKNTWNYLTETYKPTKCRIEASVCDAATHFPVIVIKE